MTIKNRRIFVHAIFFNKIIIDMIIFSHYLSISLFCAINILVLFSLFMFEPNISFNKITINMIFIKLSLLKNI